LIFTNEKKEKPLQLKEKRKKEKKKRKENLKKRLLTNIKPFEHYKKNRNSQLKI